ncbi:DUF2027 domain-containing protein [Hoylesella oralis]|uniref:DUF2027 domain-containing protein n=1 Tax=Hoylesella oralis TaxID=28134 RepID=UPI00361ABD0D
MKIGDKVRFLSETGGGKIAGFQGKNIVLVEDEDGFQIPTSIRDVVVIENEDYSIAKVIDKTVSALSAKQMGGAAVDGQSVKAKIKEGMDEAIDMNVESYDPADREISFQKPLEERKGGNLLSAYLAFVPVDIKEITNTRFECYFVNDSNYYMQYAYMTAEGQNWSLKSQGEIEPNTKEFIEEFGREDLNSLEHVSVQLVAYKRDKSFILKPSVDVQFRIDNVKFYKLHTFQENDFFEQPALLYTIIENDKPARPLVTDAKSLKEQMYAKSSDNQLASTVSSNASTGHDNSYVRRYDDRRKQANPFRIKHRDDEDTVVIDLHAEALLETTAGMNNADILNYQLKKFCDTLADYSSKKGQKIVFIHGKGEGVLRSAIIHELNYRYKRYLYQDASFQEYGYGATQVTIR